MTEQKNYEELTNKELSDLVETRINEGENILVDAKNPSKPNKTEFITALKKADAELASIEEEVEQINVPAKKDIAQDPVKKITRAADLPRSKRRALQQADLFRKECVILSDNRESQTKEDVMFVSWGNGLIGAQTDVVHFGPEKQYVRRGALKNLRKATITEYIQDPNFEKPPRKVTKPRFTVVQAEGLTEEELTKKKVEQQIKLANMI